MQKQLSIIGTLLYVTLSYAQCHISIPKYLSNYHLSDIAQIKYPEQEIFKNINNTIQTPTYAVYNTISGLYDSYILEHYHWKHFKDNTQKTNFKIQAPNTPRGYSYNNSYNPYNPQNTTNYKGLKNIPYAILLAISNMLLKK